MDCESLVVNYLKDYIPHTMITLIFEYSKFHGLLEGLINIDGIHNILVLPNQKIITYSVTKPNIQLWNPNDKTCEKSFDVPMVIKSMELLMDGRIVCVFFGGLIKLFDPINWKFDIEMTLEYEIKLVNVISKDMIYLLVSDFNFDYILLLKKWNITTNTYESISMHVKNMFNRFFFYDHERFIECLDTGTMYLSDVSQIEQKCIPLFGHKKIILSLLLFPNKNHLVSGSFDHSIKIWDMNKYICIKTLIGHTDSVINLTMMRLSDNRLVSVSGDKTIKIWNLNKNVHDNVNDDGCEITLKNDSIANGIRTTCDGRIISLHYETGIKFWI